MSQGSFSPPPPPSPSPSPPPPLKSSNRTLYIVLGVVAGSLALCCGTGLVVGILMIAVQKSREAARRMECVNNLKQIGLGAHMYADANNGVFPTESKGESVFYQLLPFVEEQSMYNAISVGGPPGDVKIYLCPSRRRPPTGACGDYGYGAGPGEVGVTVLAAPAPGLTFREITNADGTSTTLFLSHKGMNTEFYGGGGLADTGWNSLDHKRSPGSIYQDCSTSERNMSVLIGSPHPNICPSVWCDGHVSNIPYTFTQMPQVWSYNDGTAVSPP